jgi:antitoxin PrlF
MAGSGSKTAYSKVSVKSQTVLPREVRDRLRIAPGDQIRYILDDDGVRIEKRSTPEEGDPFEAFTEWASAADDEAYADL